MKGYQAAPSFTSVGATLAGACVGAAYVVKLDKTTRLFAGTQTKLYELAGTSFSDVSRVGNYVGSTDSVWRFAQFGDVSLAVNGTDETQYSVSTGSFADLSGAANAAVMDTVGGFVMLGNYDDGTNTPDGIYWSGYLDYTAWTPSVATQCGNLRLLDTAGEVTAIKRLGQNAIAYKKSSMYLGVNNAPPVLWGFTLISGEIGAVSHESVVSIETAHYFISEYDIYVFDGSRPVPIGEGIREAFFDDLNTAYSYKIRGIHDKNKTLIYWYYPDQTSEGELNACIVYNYKTGKWGRADRDIEVCLEYISSASSYSSFMSAYATYDLIPSLSYGSPFWTSSSFNMGVFNTSHELGTLTGAASASSLTTGAIGDDIQLTMIDRVQPRFITLPSASSMENYYRMTDGDSYTYDSSSAISSGRYDLFRVARWHKFKLSFTGDVELVGNTYTLQPEGLE